jgi:hypothetical protein
MPKTNNVAFTIDMYLLHISNVTAEYKRGIITGIEYLAEVTTHVKAIEDLRNDERF